MNKRTNTMKQIAVWVAAPALLIPSAARANGFADVTEKPELTFGVVSDPHMGDKAEAPAFLENALRRLAEAGVDAVVCPGDIAHSGLISEMEMFAEIWNRVFPGGRRPDGGTVELLLVTGNHDIDAWGGRWNGFTEEELAAKRFFHEDNPEKTWRRLFGQEWSPVWRREVKGFTFLGAQWRTVEPPIEDFVAKEAPTLDPDKPFFYIQHAHPAGTCHGPYSDGDDKGEARRALAPFPNAVAISGHSHCALSDERGVWQGAFTSIGAGSTQAHRLPYERPEYVNASAAWHSSYTKKIMAPLSNEWEGRNVGGDFELVEVFADRLVVHRLAVAFDEPISPAWTIPFPAREGGPLDFARRAASGTPPQFPADADVRAEFRPGGHALEGPGHAGEPCVALTFPCAENVGGHRVFDYEIRAEAEGAEAVVRRIMAPGFAFPEKYANLPGTCLFSPSELPTGGAIRFIVTPRDCFGGKGRPLTIAVSLATPSLSGSRMERVPAVIENGRLSFTSEVNSGRGARMFYEIARKSDP